MTFGRQLDGPLLKVRELLIGVGIRPHELRIELLADVRSQAEPVPADRQRDQAAPAAGER